MQPISQMTKYAAMDTSDQMLCWSNRIGCSRSSTQSPMAPIDLSCWLPSSVEKSSSEGSERVVVGEEVAASYLLFYPN